MVDQKITYLVAETSGLVRIPLMAFSTPEDGLKFLSELSIVTNEFADFTLVHFGENGFAEPLETFLASGNNHPVAQKIRKALFVSGIYSPGVDEGLEVSKLMLLTRKFGEPVITYDM